MFNHTFSKLAKIILEICNDYESKENTSFVVGWEYVLTF